MDKTTLKQSIAALSFALIYTAFDVFVHWEAAGSSHIAAFLVSLALGLLVFTRPFGRFAKHSGKKILNDLFVTFEWKISDRVFFLVIFFVFLVCFALWLNVLGAGLPRWC